MVLCKQLRDVLKRLGQLKAKTIQITADTAVDPKTVKQTAARLHARDRRHNACRVTGMGW